jgi:regulator of sirC expression with transglutaminase-like and TPR domain
MASENQIKALINLVDDSDESIYFQVREELLNMGIKAVPHLEEAWEKNDLGETFQLRIEDLIHEIQFTNVTDSLIDWTKKGGKQLLTGVLLINKYHYPDLNTLEIKSIIQRMADRLISKLLANDTPRIQIVKLNQVLFQEFHLHGDNDDYYSSKNSFLNKVLERRKGNPLLLSVIYIEVARLANIPVVGINLPRHFVVGLKNDYNDSMEFYISPFNQGSILTKEDIEVYLKKINLPVEPKYYEECSNVEILLRIVLNLINSYTKSKEMEKLDEISLLYNNLVNLKK